MKDNDTSRRKFLAGAGAAGVIGLAGCTGGGGGSGGGDSGGSGGGGSGGGDSGGSGGGGDGGDGGGGGDGGSTGGGDMTPMNIVYPPWPGLPAFNYITQDTDILENELNEEGYTTGKISRSWDDTTLFLSGQADFMPTAGGAESARMALARDLDLTVHAQAATNYMAWYVRTGSDLDPEVSGLSFAETLQKMSDEDRPYGHAGWNQGIVWPNSAIIYNELGWDYGPDNRPPLNVRQADFATLPRLLYDEQIDMATNAPPVGVSPYLVGEHADDPPLKPIKWEQVGLQEAGLSPRTLNLGGFTSRKEFSDNNEGAMIAWMRAWQQGVEWAATTDNWGSILDNEKNWDYLAAESREEAEINLHFSFAENPAEDPVAHTDNPLPVVLKDFVLTDERIEQYKEAIRAVQESGALGDGDWESRLEFKALSL